MRRVEDVVGVQPLLEGAQPGVLHSAGHLTLADVQQHLHGALQQAGGVGQVLPGAPRRRAVDGLEHGALLADVGRAGHADAAGDLRGHVGEDVAVEVGHHHHVELLRGVGQLGRADVDDPGFLFQVRVLAADFLEHLMEQAVGEFHDVVFDEAADLAPALLAGVVEGVADDALAAGAADQLEALEHLVGLAVLDTGVEVLLILAHDHQVHGRVFGLHEGRVGHAGADVGVEAERLAGGHVEALVAATLRGGDRRLEEDLGPPQGFPGLGSDAGQFAALVHGFADFDHLRRNGGAGGIEDAQGGFHDFRADAVAVGHGDGSLVHDAPRQSGDSRLFWPARLIVNNRI